MNAVGKDPLLYVLLMHALESEIKFAFFSYILRTWFGWFGSITMFARV
jgi:hypothetical protein